MKKHTINVIFNIEQEEDGHRVETIFRGDGSSLAMLEAAAASLIVVGHKTLGDCLNDVPAVATEAHSERLYKFYENTAKNLSEALGVPIKVAEQQPSEEILIGARPKFNDLSGAISAINVMGEIASLAGACEADLDPKLSTELTAEMSLLVDRLDADPDSVSVEECNAVLNKVKGALDKAKNQHLN